MSNHIFLISVNSRFYPLPVTLIQITRIYAQVLRCSLHAMINVNLLVQKLYNDEIENIRNCGLINNSKAKEKHYFLHFVRSYICRLFFVDFRAGLESLELNEQNFDLKIITATVMQISHN